jgi:hypothetical protein
MQEAKNRLRLCSYKNTPGYHIFGSDWQDIHALCDELMENRFYERKLLRRFMIIGHKLSQPPNEQTEGYTMIMKDLQRRHKEQTELIEKLEKEVAESFEELCKRRNIKL